MALNRVRFYYSMGTSRLLKCETAGAKYESFIVGFIFNHNSHQVCVERIEFNRVFQEIKILTVRTNEESHGITTLFTYSLEKVHAGLPICDVLETNSDKSPHDYILASLAFEFDTSTDVDETETVQTCVDLSAVVGSPLKLRDFQSELKFIPDKSGSRTLQKTSLNRFKPVSVSEARRLVSLYNLSAQSWMKCEMNSDHSSWPSLWVLCDGLDVERTSFISTSVELSHCNEKNFQRFPAMAKHESSLSNGSSPTVNHFTIRSFTVNVTGPLTEQCKPPTLASLIKNNALKQLPSASYCARYELIGKASLVTEGSTPSRENVGLCQGSVEAAVHWDHKSSLLDEPAVGASALLSIRTVSGDPRSSAYGLFNDLCTLQGLSSGLTDGEVRWSVVDSDRPLLDRVLQLIEDQKLGDSASIGKQKDDRASSTEGPIKNHLLAEREDLDFTERLWNVLRDCSSYSDLVLSLQHVIDCLVKGNFQPMVHKQNKTKLAEIVRDSYYGQLDPKVLSRVSPLELVVEVGFDKLFRDYSDLFLSKDVVTMNNLKWFLSCDDNEDDTSFNSRWLRLEKLHRVLEMLVMLERYLMLPRSQLCSAVRQALKFYETHPLSSHDVFTLPIPAAVIWSLITSCRPYLWKVNCESYTATHNKLQAAVAMTMSAPFSHMSFLESTQDLINDSKNYVGYFVTAINQFAFDV